MRMNLLRQPGTVLTGGLVAMGSVILVMMASSLLMQREAAWELGRLIHQLQGGISAVQNTARLLPTTPEALAEIQQHNDRNIAHYQVLASGSLRHDLPSFAEVGNQDWISLTPTFAAFQEQVGGLLQARLTLERLQQSRLRLQQTASNLVAQSDQIVMGLEQAQASLPHLRAGYRIQALLLTHRAQLSQPASEKPAPDHSATTLQSSLLDLLNRLSTATDAPPSPALRRAALNLRKAWEDHAIQLQSLEQQHLAARQLLDLQQDLNKSVPTLSAQMDSALQQLDDTVQSDTVWLILLVIFLVLLLTTLLSLSLFWLGATRGAAQHHSLPAVPNPPVSRTDNERTSPEFLQQLRMEKNQLMSDMKPIADGILYIHADEKRDATGDLAHCLNQCRESLVKRIEQLRQHTQELQKQLTVDRVHTAADSTPHSAALPGLIELTLRGNAELDGLQRRLQQLSDIDDSDRQPLLARCLGAEQILDEIRVRLRVDTAGIAQLDVTNRESGNTAADTLVQQLIRYLDEFKTQAPKSRRHSG